MSEELFAVPTGGKPALLVAREKLAAVEGRIKANRSTWDAMMALAKERDDAQREVQILEHAEMVEVIRRSALRLPLAKEGV